MAPHCLTYLFAPLTVVHFSIYFIFRSASHRVEQPRLINLFRRGSTGSCQVPVRSCIVQILMVCERTAPETLPGYMRTFTVEFCFNYARGFRSVYKPFVTPCWVNIASSLLPCHCKHDFEHFPPNVSHRIVAFFLPLPRPRADFSHCRYEA